MPTHSLSDRIRFFIHPIPLSAVALMALNDHWFKYRFSNVVTGKLSDFCGVFYLPIFLLALLVVFDGILKLKKFRIGAISTIGAIVFTDLLMILVKLSPLSARFIEDLFARYWFPIQLIQDPTDLVSLVVNPLTYFYMKPYWSSSKET